MAKKQSQSQLQRELYADFERLIKAEEKLKSVPKRKSRVSKNSARRRPRKKTSKQSTSNRRTRKRSSGKKRSQSRSTVGYGNRIKVDRATHFKKQPRISIWRVNRFKRAIRITRSTSVSFLMSILLPLGLNHYAALGKVEQNIYYIRLYYNHAHDSVSNVKSSFSIGATKCSSAEQYEMYLETTVEAFLLGMHEYEKQGFRKINLKGIETRGWIKA